MDCRFLQLFFLSHGYLYTQYIADVFCMREMWKEWMEAFPSHALLPQTGSQNQLISIMHLITTDGTVEAEKNYLRRDRWFLSSAAKRLNC